jgi:hypothetical protein
MPDQPLRKSRWNWLRLSVRGLIVLVLIIGGGLGWIAHFMRSAQVQQDAVAAVRKVGGSVLYDWQFEGGKVRVKPGANIISDEVPGVAEMAGGSTRPGLLRLRDAGQLQGLRLEPGPHRAALGGNR